MIEIRRYIVRAGKDVIGGWLMRLVDTQGTGIPGLLLRIDRKDMRAVAVRGDKRRQSSNILRAVDYLRDYQERTQAK